MKNAFSFTVPPQKRVRMIVDTDCKNEADDQFALAHHLMTPMFDVRGIIAAHFERGREDFRGRSARASYEEIERVLALMGLSGRFPVLLGCESPLAGEDAPVESEGARFIVREAMRDDPRPLYIALQGAATDLASALLMEPSIAPRLTAVWIGGEAYPEGGEEFNLLQDVAAANAVFASGCEVWQIPKPVYKLMNVSLAELQHRVAPCGEIGAYLFRQMVELNDALGDFPWPHGETWCIGDQPTVGVLLEDRERRNYTIRPAPRVLPDGRYAVREGARLIRVYDTVDARLTLEDFYAKLALNYGD